MVQLLRQYDEKVQGFNRDNLNLEKVTLTDLAGLLSKFDVVVNAIGYTNVELAEIERDKAFHANAFLASKLANACSVANVRFFHISTNFVFSGKMETPYKISSEMDALNTYGISKAWGEKLIGISGAESTIFRTAWLYGEFGNCFPAVVLKRIAELGSISIVDDQFGQPTWTRDLAEQVFQYSRIPERVNIVHAVASGQTSWANFAHEILCSSPFAETGHVTEISSTEYPSRVQRPIRAVLDNRSSLVPPIADWLSRWNVASAFMNK
jgi:dTDP-4-dehydrorhamnose reductase